MSWSYVWLRLTYSPLSLRKLSRRPPSLLLFRRVFAPFNHPHLIAAGQHNLRPFAISGNFAANLHCPAFQFFDLRKLIGASRKDDGRERCLRISLFEIEPGDSFSNVYFRNFSLYHRLRADVLFGLSGGNSDRRIGLRCEWV